MKRSFIHIALAIAAGFATPAEAIQWPAADGGNNHYYLSVVARTPSWDAAAAAAVAEFGPNAYLATLTTAEEDLFVRTHVLQLGINSWIGGFQAPGSTEPAGGWGWITGEPWLFTNWAPNEPNNSLCCGGPEDALELLADGLWNDAYGGNPKFAYIVESVTPLIPEPAAYALMAAGLGVLGVATRRRKT